MCITGYLKVIDHLRPQWPPWLFPSGNFLFLDFFWGGGPEHLLRGTFSNKFQVKVVKVDFATTTVKFATSKVQRPGFFFSLVPHPLSLCTVLELAVMQIN